MDDVNDDAKAGFGRVSSDGTRSSAEKERIVEEALAPVRACRRLRDGGRSALSRCSAGAARRAWI